MHKKINFIPVFDLAISYCSLVLLFVVVLKSHSNISIFVVGIIFHSLILHRLGLFIHSYLYRRNHKWFADTFFHTSDCLKKKSLYYFILLCVCEILERIRKLFGGQLGQLRAIFKKS